MTHLGKYELQEAIGQGGFGTVYRAEDTSLGREVAVKILHPQLTLPDFLTSFRKEASLVAGIHHPNIVTVYELGETDGRVFLVMEYLNGGSLESRILKGPFTFEAARPVFTQICAGLEDLHRQGWIHRDIKPANILFNRRGEAVITDFGLAKSVLASSASSLLGGAGTPFYKAPEIWDGEIPGPPADVYSLGCVLYEMLTGQVLFSGKTPEQVLTRHLVRGADLTGFSPLGAPEGLRAVLEKALTRDPQERYPSAGVFGRAVEQLETPETTSRAVVSGQIAELKEALETALRIEEWEEAEALLAELETLVPYDRSIGLYRRKLEKGRAAVHGSRETQQTSAKPEPVAQMETIVNPPDLSENVDGEDTLYTLDEEWIIETVPYSLAYSPDGSILACGLADRTIKLWRAGDGKQIANLKKHSDIVFSIAFSPDGQYLASGSLDKTLRLWQVNKGSLVYTAKGDFGCWNCVAFSPDGRFLAGGSEYQFAWLLQIQNDKFFVKQEFKNFTDEVGCVAFFPDGRWLATGSDDGSIRVWQVADGALVYSAHAHAGAVNSIAYTPDGKTLASGSDDGSVRLWKASDGTLIRKLEGHSDWVNCVAFTPDGKILASGSEDWTVKLWDASDGRLLNTLGKENQSSINTIAFSPNAKVLASGSEDGVIRLWKACGNQG
jgi:WD40 repeat protein